VNTIIATTINKVYLDLTKNWIANLEKFGLKNNIIVFCLDRFSYDSLKNDVTCILDDAGTEALSRAEWIEIEKFFKYKRPLEYARKHKCNVLFSDTDVVFLKDPLVFFINQCEKADIAVTSDKRYDSFHLERQKDKIITTIGSNVKDWGYTDQHKFGELNGAVAYYKYSEQFEKIFISFFNEFTFKKYPKGIEEGAAQTAFNDFVKEFNNTVKIKKISVFDFANGSLLNVAYLKKKVLENAYGIHYNFCENLDPIPSCREKIKKIKEDGFWLI
jgi:hypothetical protein